MVSRIVGKKFNCISRAIDMLCLFLGEDHIFTDSRGEQIDVAEFSVHFQSQWRFRDNDTILLASMDIYTPYCDNVPEDWEYDLVGRADELSSVFDVRAKELSTKMRGAVVCDCHLSPANDMIIVFSNGVVFEQFIVDSERDEEWRLIDYKNDEHIVCYGEEGTISVE